MEKKIFDFNYFGGERNERGPSNLFRENVGFFLQEYAVKENYEVLGMEIWCTYFVHNDIEVPFYVVEEAVKNPPSSDAYCLTCQSIGWSKHFISKKIYHFLIPCYDEWNKPIDEDVFEDETLLLYGKIHANGFGHLLVINGIEGGSNNLVGSDILELWDGICKFLQARNISVTDALKKRAMELRLLFGVAYGHSWFGKCGYSFGHGSFGINKSDYRRAAEALSSLNLDEIIDDFKETEQAKKLQQIINLYRKRSPGQLNTLGQLLCYLLAVKSAMTTSTNTSLSSSSTLISLPNNSREFSSVIARIDSRWPKEIFKQAADNIIKVLNEEFFNGNKRIQRKEVRAAASSLVQDTELVTSVLKSLNNVVVGNHIIRRAVDPVNKILEYTIHEVDAEVSEEHEIVSSTMIASGNDLYRDIIFLYKHVLVGYPDSEIVEFSSQILLDTVHFFKAYLKIKGQDGQTTVFCRLLTSSTIGDSAIDEIVKVATNAKVLDLKKEVQDAFKLTYVAMEEIRVEEIDGLGEVDDEMLLDQLKSQAIVSVTATGVDLTEASMQQGGSSAWNVACLCGANDDDGEHMVMCHKCDKWQHTRCLGIDEAVAAGMSFICSDCENTGDETLQEYLNDRDASSAAVTLQEYFIDRDASSAAAIPDHFSDIDPDDFAPPTSE